MSISSGGMGMAYDEMESIAGGVAVTIPAADLSGGTTNHGDANDRDAVLLVDFSDDSFLDPGEVFELHRMNVAGYAAAHTTATAEGYMVAAQHISRENVIPDLPTSFFGGTPTEDGVYDVRANPSMGINQGSLFHWKGVSSAGFNDTTNGTGGGAHHTTVHELVDYTGFDRGPLFDRDDEIFAPAQIMTDNISNHAVEVASQVQLWGEIHDVDENEEMRPTLR